MESREPLTVANSFYVLVAGPDVAWPDVAWGCVGSYCGTCWQLGMAGSLAVVAH